MFDPPCTGYFLQFAIKTISRKLLHISISIPKYEHHMCMNGHGLGTKVCYKHLPEMIKGTAALSLYFISGGISMLEVKRNSIDTSINNGEWACM